VLKGVIDDMTLWGFDLVMAGNIKGFLDRTADPISIKPEADKRRLDYRMCTAYTDGTKLCVEMALIANALGLDTTVPGMLGPRAQHVDEVTGLFDFAALWQDRQPVVDYILGARPGGGVFAVGYQDHPFQAFMLDYYKMGPGPFYVFYRPYHLCHVESLASIVRPALDGTSLLQPDHGFRTDVFAYAKRDLRAGEMLDGMGGHTCYGLIENVGNRPHPGLEICLAHDLPVTRDIKAGEAILLDDVRVAPDREDFRFRKLALAAAGAVAEPGMAAAPHGQQAAVEISRRRARRSPSGCRRDRAAGPSGRPRTSSRTASPPRSRRRPRATTRHRRRRQRAGGACPGMARSRPHGRSSSGRRHSPRFGRA
jgi:predicted homoserine dehydrogenase-like protein